MNEINLFGVIGQDVTAADVKAQLASFSDHTAELVCRIDSPGGMVFVGNTIANALREYPGPKRAVVESFAGSIASYLLTVFDEVDIAANGYVMIHNPTIASEGDDEEHARDAKLLGELKANMVAGYAEAMELDAAEVEAVMKAETFYSAEEAVDVGIATRVLEAPKATRIPTAFHNSLPYRVVASLKSGAPKETEPKPEESQMADSPQAATVDEIQAAFPKMKAETVLSCIRKKMPLASVAAAAAEEMMAENEELKAELAEAKELLAQYEAKAEEEAEAMEEEAEVEAMEEEEEAVAKAKAKGHQPIGNVSRQSAPSATARWHESIQANIKAGMPKAKAVKMANRQHPGLRAKYLAEVNGN